MADYQHPVWQAIDDSTLRSEINRFTLQEGDDISIWSFTTSGKFDIKSTHSYIKGQPVGSPLIKLWHRKFPPRASLFYWKVLNHAVPTDSQIQKSGVFLASCCNCCSSSHAVEDFDHLFLYSEMATFLWNKFGPILDNSCL